MTHHSWAFNHILKEKKKFNEGMYEVLTVSQTLDYAFSGDLMVCKMHKTPKLKTK